MDMQIEILLDVSPFKGLSLHRIIAISQVKNSVKTVKHSNCSTMIVARTIWKWVI